MSPDTVKDRAGTMMRLSDRERGEAIAGSADVIGFGRFADIRKRRELEQAYRGVRLGGVA